MVSAWSRLIDPSHPSPRVTPTFAHGCAARLRWPRASALLAALPALAILLLPVSAPAMQRLWPMPEPLVRMQVLDRDTGRTLPVLPHRGERWIEGAPGHRYAVRLSNLSGERVLVVLAVDGVNAVSGETAATDQAGYVLAPGQSTEINGWRKSLDDVAQFVFTDLGDSYAARTGRPRNVGVIGVAVFREAVPYPPPPPPPLAMDDAGAEDSGMPRPASAPAAAARESTARSVANATASRQSLGTGHGAREWSPVTRTDFVRASQQPDQVSTLRYDEHARLVALGVLPRPLPSARRPQAFPGGFVPDPPQGR
jgi:hypothetical protein